ISSKELSLEYIILTHGHLDHILGVNAFREKTGAKVAAYELEIEYLEDPEKSMSGGETVSTDILLKENDILTFGNISLRVIHTPGHTKGSCCLVCESEKVIFSGDTLFKGSIGRYDLYGGNYNVLMDSLKKLKSIEENYRIYPGHGGNTTLDNEIVRNPYLR
ncbi:MAG: MBL fold metallo-hydrolase, partial [Oscillospiraceae bacterium]|nr:MBL fold metallo-hydrolase [Oscillospiraceae bacterium]